MSQIELAPKYFKCHHEISSLTYQELFHFDSLSMHQPASPNTEPHIASDFTKYKLAKNPHQMQNNAFHFKT
jgi:hypothetical protein